MLRGKNIWIIGASSGIGAALAKVLNERGARLILSARSEERVRKVSENLSSETIFLPLDITEVEQIKSALGKIEKLDAVIFLAATYQPGSFQNKSLEVSQAIVDVNFKGMLNVVHVVMPRLQKQGNGQLVLCGSVAGYRGLPNAQPYSATKAAIINFAESLYAENKGTGIDVKLISPGFVRTPMTDKNDFKMPMIIEPSQAAEAIANGMTRPGFEIHFPKRFTFFMKFLALLPYPLYFAIARKMTKP